MEYPLPSLFLVIWIGSSFFSFSVSSIIWTESFSSSISGQNLTLWQLSNQNLTFPVICLVFFFFSLSLFSCLNRIFLFFSFFSYQNRILFSTQPLIILTEFSFSSLFSITWIEISFISIFIHMHNSCLRYRHTFKLSFLIKKIIV